MVATLLTGIRSWCGSLYKRVLPFGKAMKKILIYNQDGSAENLFNPRVRDNCNDPFIFLKEKLATLDYELNVWSGNMEEKADWVFFMSAPAVVSYDGLKGKIRWVKHHIFGLKKALRVEDFYENCVRRGMKERLVLFLWEGKAVSPSNYNSALYKKFNYIFTWNDALVDNKKFFKFHLPIAKDTEMHEPVAFNRKKFLVNISINKCSSTPRELYSERRKSISYFDKHFGGQFDLFGVGWNEPKSRFERLLPWTAKKFKSYKGKVDNKIEILKQYTFSLCYENLAGEDGYITEKIFDCLKAGSVPIYWGAENIEKYVEKNAFIDRRNFKSNRELGKFLSRMDEPSYQTYIEAGQRYLQNKQFSLFSRENFANTIISTLAL